jgi:hypothetical protein
VKRTTYYHGTTAVLFYNILGLGLRPGHPTDPHIYLTTDRELALRPYALAWTAEAVAQNRDAGTPIEPVGLLVSVRLRPDEVIEDDWNPAEGDQYKYRGRISPSRLYGIEKVPFPELADPSRVIQMQAFWIGIRRR